MKSENRTFFDKITTSSVEIDDFFISAFITSFKLIEVSDLPDYLLYSTEESSTSPNFD